MAGKGRPRKPTALKLLQGTARPDRMNPNEPQPEVVIPKKPAHLKGEAGREWKRIVPELVGLGLISRIDRAALAAYCTAYATYVETDRILQRAGLTFETPNGFLQQRPEVSIRARALDQMKGFLSLFGLSPADRSKVSGVGKPKKDDNPWDEFVKSA